MFGRPVTRVAAPMSYRREYFARARQSVLGLVLLSPACLLFMWWVNAWVTRTRMGDFQRPAVFGAALAIVCIVYLVMRKVASITLHGTLVMAVLATTSIAFAHLATPTLEGATWMLPAILVVPLVCASLWISPWRALFSCVASYIGGAAIVANMQALPDAALVYCALAAMLTAICMVIFYSVDRTRRVSYEDRTSLFHDAHYDTLTGLASRRRFQQLGTSLLAQCRSEGTPVTLAFIDLDHFKAVNDLHGHAAGDRALATVAELITNRAAPNMVAGRFGGEEFVVLLPRLDEKRATTYTEQLARAISRSDMGGFSVTISAGIAQLASDETLSELMQRADFALLEAKRLGRDRIVQAEGRSASTRRQGDNDAAETTLKTPA